MPGLDAAQPDAGVDIFTSVHCAACPGVISRCSRSFRRVRLEAAVAGTGRSIASPRQRNRKWHATRLTCAAAARFSRRWSPMAHLGGDRRDRACAAIFGPWVSAVAPPGGETSSTPTRPWARPPNKSAMPGHTGASIRNFCGMAKLEPAPRSRRRSHDRAHRLPGCPAPAEPPSQAAAAAMLAEARAQASPGRRCRSATAMLPGRRILRPCCRRDPALLRGGSQHCCGGAAPRAWLRIGVTPARRDQAGKPPSLRPAGDPPGIEVAP